MGRYIRRGQGCNADLFQIERLACRVGSQRHCANEDLSLHCTSLSVDNSTILTPDLIHSIVAQDLLQPSVSVVLLTLYLALTMSLCFACDEVVRGLFQKSKYSARGYFGDVWRMANIPYSGTLWDVLSTAESCRLCGLIKACFLEEHKSKFESTKHTCLEESLESRYVRDMSISAILEGGVVSHQSPDALKLTILKFLFPTKTSESDPHDYLHFSIWAERGRNWSLLLFQYLGIFL